MAIDWNKVIEQSLSQAPLILGGVAAVIIAVRRKFQAIEEKQDTALANQARLEEKATRIEEKADGNHAKALEAIKQAGKYEGKEEAKNDARFDQEQILKAVEQVLAAQSQKRGRRRSDDP